MESVRTIRVVAAVIEREVRYLITQRRPTAVLPLLWEFPGGRVEAGETDAAALKREVKHRLGVEIEAGRLQMGHERRVRSVSVHSRRRGEHEQTARRHLKRTRKLDP
jgi:mutator protein MutT